MCTSGWWSAKETARATLAPCSQPNHGSWSGFFPLLSSRRSVAVRVVQGQFLSRSGPCGSVGPVVCCWGPRSGAVGTARLGPRRGGVGRGTLSVPFVPAGTRRTRRSTWSCRSPREWEYTRPPNRGRPTERGAVALLALFGELRDLVLLKRCAPGAAYLESRRSIAGLEPPSRWCARSSSPS